MRVFFSTVLLVFTTQSENLRNSQQTQGRQSQISTSKQVKQLQISAPLFRGKILTFARTTLRNEKCARIFCLRLPISPEKRKTTSYCRVSLCLFISRIHVKPFNFLSRVRANGKNPHTILIIKQLRYTKENLVYIKRQEKQHAEQQSIKTSQFDNYLTPHYFFMKNAENGRLIYAEKRCSVHPSFLLVTTRTSTPTKKCCPICKILNPCDAFFSAVKKPPQTALLIYLTRQQNHAKLPSLARA